MKQPSSPKLLIDPACGPVPTRWLYGLIPDKASKMYVGGIANIQGLQPSGSILSLFIHRLEDVEEQAQFLLTVDGTPRVAPSAGVAVGAPDPNLTFRELWRELHVGALTLSEPNQRHHLLNDVILRLPNGRCDCRAHARGYMKTFPPNYSTKEGFFVWLFLFHNNVNTRLKKPTITLDQAVELWHPENA